jgi:hypothetical protein
MKGLSERFFVLLRMTEVKGYVVKCKDALFGLGLLIVAAKVVECPQVPPHQLPPTAWQNNCQLAS